MESRREIQANSEPVQAAVSLSVLVCDPEALGAYARRRYAACWMDEEWVPSDLAEAGVEALILSNENPSPADYGIEILRSKAIEAPAKTGRPDTPSGARKFRARGGV